MEVAYFITNGEVMEIPKAHGEVIILEISQCQIQFVSTAFASVSKCQAMLRSIPARIRNRTCTTLA